MAFRSDLPPDVLAPWHERAYRSMRDAGERRLSYLGLDLVVPVGVFAPTPTSDLLGNAVLAEVRPEDRVLDMGTGCGVNAARNGPRYYAAFVSDPDGNNVEAVHHG